LHYVGNKTFNNRFGKKIKIVMNFVVKPVSHIILINLPAKPKTLPFRETIRGGNYLDFNGLTRKVNKLPLDKILGPYYD